jgi:predicted transcriptional regulator
VSQSYPATWLFEELAQDAGVTPDDVRDYLRREIDRRTLGGLVRSEIQAPISGETPESRDGAQCD